MVCESCIKFFKRKDSFSQCVGLVRPWHWEFYWLLINKFSISVFQRRTTHRYIWHSKDMKGQTYLCINEDMQAQTNTNDLISNAGRKVPGINLDHKILCLCFISCFYSFPSCFTILHSLPALMYNCNFSYVILRMVLSLNISFILPFGFYSMVSRLFLACLSWEILLWEHLECSSFCQRQDWQSQSLLNNHKND